MKLAFITHGTGIYGASRSLRSLILELNKQHDIYIIVSKSRWEKDKLKIDKVSEWFEVTKDKINEFYLPFSACYLGKPKFNKISNIGIWIREKKWEWIDKAILLKFLCK